MCNLYSMTRNVDAIRRLFKVDPLHDRTGNLPPMIACVGAARLDILGNGRAAQRRRKRS